MPVTLFITPYAVDATFRLFFLRACFMRYAMSFATLQDAPCHALLRCFRWLLGFTFSPRRHIHLFAAADIFANILRLLVMRQRIR